MNTTSTDIVADAPRRSRPIRSLALLFEPLARPLAGRRVFHLWAILRHTGRTSGKTYATPIVALATRDGFLIPLPFGNATQWAKNLFAAGGGALRFAGKEHQVVDPRIIDRYEAAAHMPRLLHAIAGRLGLRQYVLVRRVTNQGARGS